MMEIVYFYILDTEMWFYYLKLIEDKYQLLYSII